MSLLLLGIFACTVGGEAPTVMPAPDIVSVCEPLEKIRPVSCDGSIVGVDVYISGPSDPAGSSVPAGCVAGATPTGETVLFVSVLSNSSDELAKFIGTTSACYRRDTTDLHRLSTRIVMGVPIDWMSCTDVRCDGAHGF